MSAPSLAALQHQFRDALHYQHHDLPVGNGVAPPEALLQVYRNNFVMTLTECLEAVYPVVNKLVGDDCFQAIARHHVLNTPMTDACADRYGAGFDHTIKTLPNIIGAVPYLADMAALEWHIQRVNRAPLATPFPLEKLAQVSDDAFGAIKLQCPPSVAILPSTYAIGTLWQAVSQNDDNALAGLNIAQPETVAVQLLAQGITVSVLDAEDTPLVLACLDMSLGEVDPALLPHLSAVIQRGLFNDFVLIAQ